MDHTDDFDAFDVDALIDDDVAYDDDDVVEDALAESERGRATPQGDQANERGRSRDDDEHAYPDDDEDTDEDTDGEHATNSKGQKFDAGAATNERRGDERTRGTTNDIDTRATKRTKRGEDVEHATNSKASMEEAFDFLAAVKEAAARIGRDVKLESNARCDPPVKDAASIKGEVMAITLSNGSRIFVKKESEDKPLVPVEVVFRRATDGEPLLSRSIDDMLDAFEKERYRRALDEAQAMDANNDEPAPRAMEVEEREPTKGELRAAAVRKKLSGLMWAERHAPKSFTDLLSPGYINREVLHWLKGWDKVVFGKDPPPATLKKFYSDRYAEKMGYKGKRNEISETHIALDALKRPKDKILLLSGPPGSGKTTLAHIVAQHCGYEPVEINASDDRSAATLKDKLSDALYTQSVFGKKKPACVILDEIDGSHNGGDGKGAIWMLLNMVKDSKFHAPLMRPVICICNDLYATALRPLRDVAKIFRMKQPLTNELTARIREVCLKEKVDVEPRAVALVVDRVDNDIRAALNSIQLIAKTSSKVTLRDVLTSRGGEKDSKSPALTMWQDLLRGRHTFPRSRLDGELRKTHLEKIRERIQTYGDNDSVFDGLFENIPLVGFQDGNGYRLANAIHAVLDGQMFQYKSFATGEQALRHYATECALAVHSCATHANVLTDDIQWPKTGRAAKEKTSRMEILRTQRDATDLYVQRVSIDRDATETMSFLNTIIAPGLRSVSSTYMNEDEKKTLASTVSLMRAYGLNYKPAAAKYGEQSWRAAASALILEPPIDEFTKFGGGVEALKNVERLTWQERREREEQTETASGPKHTVLVPRHAVNNSLRTIIAHELITESERRSGVASAQASADAKSQRAELKNRLALGVQGGNKHRVSANNKNAPDSGTQYKYNEGHTTGVRRTVLMRDLFPELAKK